MCSTWFAAVPSVITSAPAMSRFEDPIPQARPHESLQVDVFDRLYLDRCFDGRANALAGQDLPAARLVAQALREVHHGADRAVFEAPIETHLPHGGVSHGHAHGQ